uniref:Protein KTI12 homolog n=1 Tax=Rhabditophanes sp. KR3021 TaxID=114890 RepID=A0AC35TME4_9BILA
MPLLVVYGPPCSLKSTYVNQIVEYFVSSKGVNRNLIKIVKDEDHAEFDTSVYEDAKREKNHRSLMKALADDNLSKSKLVILDSLNYIKGYRYELHCIAKKTQTSFSLLLIDADEDVCLALNKKYGNKYTESCIKAIYMRLERPLVTDFWDNPQVLVTTTAIEPIEECKLNDRIMDLLYGNLFVSLSLKANKSTSLVPIAQKSFLTDIAKITKKIMIAIETDQAKHKFGDYITVPYTDDIEKDPKENKYLYVKRYSIRIHLLREPIILETVL